MPISAEVGESESAQKIQGQLENTRKKARRKELHVNTDYYKTGAKYIQIPGPYGIPAFLMPETKTSINTIFTIHQAMHTA